MASVETKVSYWQTTARELFWAEFDDPKRFYEAYGQASAVYYEIARRVVRTEVAVDVAPGHSEADERIASRASKYIGDMLDATAYSLMQEAFLTDVQNNNYEQLDKLVTTYQA